MRAGGQEERGWAGGEGVGRRRGGGQEEARRSHLHCYIRVIVIVIVVVIFRVRVWTKFLWGAVGSGSGTIFWNEMVTVCSRVKTDIVGEDTVD